MGKMKRLLWTVVPLLWLAWFLGRYGNNPMPPDLEQAWMLNAFTGVIGILADLSYYAAKLGLCEDRQCVRIGIEVLGHLDTMVYSDRHEVNVSEALFDGVPVTIYQPLESDGSLTGGLVNIHGGGFMSGHANNYERMNFDLVRDLGITVVFVDYRLAPEHPSPVPLEDCERAARYFFKNAQSYRVDNTQIGVIGDSAGANLATALTIKLRDSNDGVQFKYQMLLYPILQGLNVDLPSFHQNEEYAFFFIKQWSVAGVIATYLGFWDYKTHIDLIRSGTHVSPQFRDKYQHFVDWQKIPQKYIREDYTAPKRPQTSEDHMTSLNQLGFTKPDEINHAVSKFEQGLADPLNFPLMAPDLSNLPPAYVLACEYDTLRDDALLYAYRLQESGNDVVLDYQEQGWHGYIFFAYYDIPLESALHAYQNMTQFAKDMMLRK